MTFEVGQKVVTESGKEYVIVSLIVENGDLVTIVGTDYKVDILWDARGGGDDPIVTISEQA